MRRARHKLHTTEKKSWTKGFISSETRLNPEGPDFLPVAEVVRHVHGGQAGVHQAGVNRARIQ